MNREHRENRKFLYAQRRDGPPSWGGWISLGCYKPVGNRAVLPGLSITRGVASLVPYWEADRRSAAEGELSCSHRSLFMLRKQHRRRPFDLGNRSFTPPRCATLRPARPVASPGVLARLEPPTTRPQAFSFLNRSGSGESDAFHPSVPCLEDLRAGTLNVSLHFSAQGSPQVKQHLVPSTGRPTRCCASKVSAPTPPLRRPRSFFRAAA